MDVGTLVSELTQLAIIYLQERERLKERASAEDFRIWLSKEAFPLLLTRSEQILQSVVSLKSAEHERFSQLIDHVVAIREMVEGPSVGRVWRGLSEVDRRVLLHLLQQARMDDVRNIRPDELATLTKASTDSVASSARYLHEQGWALRKPFTGGWMLCGTPAGARFAWEATEPAEYSQAVRSISQALTRTATSVGAIAEAAGVVPGLAFVVLEKWAEAGLLTLGQTISPTVANRRVLDVKESLRRALGVQLTC